MCEDKNLVAYCGLYCAACFAYQGKIADMARDLRKELRAAKMEKTVAGIPFKEFENYQQCYEVLGAFVKLRCKSACRGGGGNPFCKIRKCCQKKELQGCWECEEFESCTKLDTLKVNHGIAHIKNLKALAKKGLDQFITGKTHWYTEK
ncbi:DUF3795 domain-containing protein [candidate division KSB1 bacterium]|nr:DUF3795 domain-containing protein [candidate division KSB1 bacterium]MBL7095520.1 DUF3795 domain-containing protein [candidate division KSB1 bacterium]